MTGFIFVISDSEESFSAICTLCKCDSNHLDGNISTFCDGFLTNFSLQGTILSEETKDRILSKKILLRKRASFSGI